MTIENIIALLSAFGVGTIFSAVLVFVNNSKKNKLDYITKERSEWRKELKLIAKDLASEENKKEAILKLKTHINPYGKRMDFKNNKVYFMREGHIWDLIEETEDNINYEKLSLFIELLLKYNWERSKQEIIFRPSVLFNNLLKFTLIILSILACYFVSKQTNFPNSDWVQSIYFLFSIISCIFLLLQKTMTEIIVKNPSKNNNEKLTIFILFYAFPSLFIFYVLGTEFKQLQNILYSVMSFVFIFIYEWSYLSNFYSIDDDYVRELERLTRTKNKMYKEGVMLSNRISKMEAKFYQYDYDSTDLKRLRKKYKKYQKRLVRKNRPKEFFRHPILYFRYRKNISRISNIVKKKLRN
ncbi:hypothetical protein [Streptococcus sp. SS-4456]|uniref:hypothetical protein n=1 Tax=Streptococcus sp. SS-4456 TaxID=3072286 RepID=UPI002FCBA620